MPQKIRELKSRLAKAGFTSRPGKGDHTVWEHAKRPGLRVVLSGNDGRDARRYQERQVEAAIREVEGAS
jgi:predicted RNA binding protein YcfA (HicA-like mRNA interferase family)